MKKELSPKQVDFAEWLAKPPFERSPATIKEKASELGMGESTLRSWQTLPPITQLISSINAKRLIDLVIPSIALLESAIKHPDSVGRVSFDAAKYIVQDWAKRTHTQDDICRTIVDFYKRYHPGE